jgi:hypothetical protein
VSAIRDNIEVIIYDNLKLCIALFALAAPFSTQVSFPHVKSEIIVGATHHE